MNGNGYAKEWTSTRGWLGTRSSYPSSTPLRSKPSGSRDSGCLRLFGLVAVCVPLVLLIDRCACMTEKRQGYIIPGWEPPSQPGYVKEQLFQTGPHEPAAAEEEVEVEEEDWDEAPAPVPAQAKTADEAPAPAAAETKLSKRQRAAAEKAAAKAKAAAAKEAAKAAKEAAASKERVEAETAATLKANASPPAEMHPWATYDANKAAAAERKKAASKAKAMAKEHAAAAGAGAGGAGELTEWVLETANGLLTAAEQRLSQGKLSTGGISTMLCVTLLPMGLLAIQEAMTK